MMGDLIEKRSQRVPRGCPFCHARHSEKVAACKPGSEPSPGPKPGSALVSCFPASRTVKNKCLLFKVASLRYLVTAARADWTRGRHLAQRGDEHPAP